MTKNFLLVLFTIAIFSCKKNDTNPVNFQFQLNGTVYSFDSVGAWIDTTAGAYMTTIHAANTTTHSHVEVQTQSNLKNLNGNYSHISPQPSNNILVLFSIFIVSGQSISSYAIEGTPFTFTINESSNFKMQGSFAGLLTFLSPNQDVNITNGKFDVTYKFK